MAETSHKEKENELTVNWHRIAEEITKENDGEKVSQLIVYLLRALDHQEMKRYTA